MKMAFVGGLRMEELFMYILNGKGNLVRLLAGIFTLLSLLLATVVSFNWLWFTAFIGFNLIVSSITGFCLLEKILKSVGVKQKTLN